MSLFPGLGTNDSYTHIGEFTSGNFRDQHPVFIPLWWGFLKLISGTWASFYLANLVMLLVAEVILIYRFQQSKWIWLAPMFMASPWVINFAGVAWKDVLLSSALVLAFSITLLRRSWFSIFLFVVLVSMALAARQNAVFVVAPMIYAAALQWFNKSFRLKLLASFTMMGAALVVPALSNFVAQPEKTHPLNHQLVDDIAIVSMSEGQSLLPGPSLEEILECRNHREFGLNNNGYIRCLGGWGLSGDRSLRSESLIGPWFEAVKTRPDIYLEYRAAKFIEFLGLDDLTPQSFFQPGTRYSSTYVNTTGWDFNEEKIGFRVVASLVDTTARLFPFTFLPIFWLVASNFLAITAARLGETHLAWLFFSGAMYAVAWFPLTIAGDLRFLNPTVWLTIWGLLVMIFAHTGDKTSKFPKF